MDLKLSEKYVLSNSELTIQLFFALKKQKVLENIIMYFHQILKDNGISAKKTI